MSVRQQQRLWTRAEDFVPPPPGPEQPRHEPPRDFAWGRWLNGFACGSMIVSLLFAVLL